jgi:hypothetical protein
MFCPQVHSKRGAPRVSSSSIAVVGAVTCAASSRTAVGGADAGPASSRATESGVDTFTASLCNAGTFAASSRTAAGGAGASAAPLSDAVGDARGARGCGRTGDAAPPPIMSVAASIAVARGARMSI